MGSAMRTATAPITEPTRQVFRAADSVSGGRLSSLNPARIAGTDEFQVGDSPMMGELGGLMGLQRARIEGQQPSLAQMQMREGMEQSLADTTSAIRSAPSISPALQARMIAQAGQDQSSELARAQSVLRAAEQAQDIQTQAGLIGQGMQHDLGMAGIRAGAHEGAAGRRSELFGRALGGLGQAASVFGIGG